MNWACGKWYENWSSYRRHMGSKKRRKFQKSRDFLGAFKWGLYFSWSFFEKSCSNLVNTYSSFFIRGKYWLTKDLSGGLMTTFHSTSKADFCILQIPFVLKIFTKPRPHKNSPATGVTPVNYEGSNLLEEKVLILETFPQNSECLELFQVMSK